MEKNSSTIKVKMTKEGPLVAIKGFENLSPVKIEKCFEAVTREWYRLRAVSIGERRKQEIKDVELAGVQNG